MVKERLKTLKEIGNFDNGCTEEYEKDLRAEAVKWVKFHSKDGRFQSRSNIIGRKYYCPKCRWIKKFFNLTEEDLE